MQSFPETVLVGLVEIHWDTIELNQTQNKAEHDAQHMEFALGRPQNKVWPYFFGVCRSHDKRSRRWSE